MPASARTRCAVSTVIWRIARLERGQARWRRRRRAALACVVTVMIACCCLLGVAQVM